MFEDADLPVSSCFIEDLLLELLQGDVGNHARPTSMGQRELHTQAVPQQSGIPHHDGGPAANCIVLLPEGQKLLLAVLVRLRLHQGLYFPKEKPVNSVLVELSLELFDGRRRPPLWLYGVEEGKTLPRPLTQGVFRPILYPCEQIFNRPRGVRGGKDWQS